MTVHDPHVRDRGSAGAVKTPGFMVGKLYVGKAITRALKPVHTLPPSVISLTRPQLTPSVLLSPFGASPGAQGLCVSAAHDLQRQIPGPAVRPLPG